MHINFRCRECETVNPVSYGTLFQIWKPGYDQMPAEKKSESYLTAEIRCLCGHTDKFDSPMFRYVFATVFDTLMGLED